MRQCLLMCILHEATLQTPSVHTQIYMRLQTLLIHIVYLQVSLLHMVLRADFVDCWQATAEGFIMHYDLSQDPTSIYSEGNTSAYVQGSHIVKVPLIPIDQQSIGATLCKCKLR